MSLIDGSISSYQSSGGGLYANETIASGGGSGGELTSEYVSTALIFIPGLIEPVEIQPANPTHFDAIGFVGEGAINTLDANVLKSATNYTFAVEIGVNPLGVGVAQLITFSPWQGVFAAWPAIQTTIPLTITLPAPLGTQPNIIKTGFRDGLGAAISVDVYPTPIQTGLVLSFTPTTAGNHVMLARFTCGIKPAGA